LKTGSSIIWLGRQRERQILESCNRHVEKVLEVVKEAYKVFTAFCRGEVEEVERRFKRVFDLEREADSIKDGIIDELSKGVLHPINRDEVIRLLLTVDDIADFAKTSARRLLFVQPKKLSQDLRENLKIMAELFLKASEATDEAFKSLLHDPRKAIEASNRVERIEERVDDFRFESIIPEFLKWCESSRDPGQCLIVFSIIESMENLVDRCEISADVIRHIAISYL